MTTLATQSGILGSLEDDIRRKLLGLAAKRELAPGERLLRQGQANDDLFIVVNGGNQR